MKSSINAQNFPYPVCLRYGQKNPSIKAASSLLRFAHKIPKNRLQGDCEPPVRFTLQTAQGCRIIGIFAALAAQKSTSATGS
jgi:hypothetical protein